MAQTRSPIPEPTAPANPHHPVLEALHLRAPWSPRPFTRALSRVSPGTRAIASQVEERELAWREVTARALAGDHPLWIVLGDSIAQGVGASHISRSWVARIGGALAADGRPHGIVNLSRSGARSLHVREDQLPLVELVDRRAALITCGVGSNDLMRNPHPPSVSARVNELIDELPPQTIISTLPAPAVSPSARWINRSVTRTAVRRGLHVVDVVPHLRGPRRGSASDRFHPNDHGYGAWVDAYAAALDLDPAALPDEWDPLDGEDVRRYR
ncbi:MAG: SGNH/GDSL hydrolase family protein [Acidimicrobiales bacterium]|nr:SGNH/GDSL hydrolase family protein [Acidimicrobiales bacterium]